MTPSCYSLRIQSNQTVTLYFGEVGTAECLAQLPSLECVVLNEFCAERGGSWIFLEEMPGKATVEWWLGELADDSLLLVDFSAQIGTIHLSTHDDGEAHLDFSSREEALAFLPKLIGSDLASIISPQLAANPDSYIAVHDGSLTVFPTFDAYLAGT